MMHAPTARSRPPRRNTVLIPNDRHQIFATAGPLHQFGRWTDLRRERAALFERACQRADLLKGRWDALGKDHDWLTRYSAPLRAVVPEAQVLPFGDSDGEWDSGW